MTSNHRVIYGTREYIGVGDSSALRFLCDILLAGVLDTNGADVLGQYIIFVANRYVDGCSGGPDRTVIRKDAEFRKELVDHFSPTIAYDSVVQFVGHP